MNYETNTNNEEQNASVNIEDNVIKIEMKWSENENWKENREMEKDTETIKQKETLRNKKRK